MNLRPREERGAVAVFLSLTLVLVLGIAALAVDLGMQRVSRRDMQAIADVVALDVARTLHQKTVAQLQNDIDPAYTTGALAQSLARNDEYLGDDLTVTATLGYLDASGAFVPMIAAMDKPTAVRVTAAADVDFAFRSGEGSVSRTAIASTIKAACFALGSFAARFRSSDSALLATLIDPLNELLRPQANLSVADYTGLATATATLEQLSVAAGAASPESFLTSGVTAQSLIAASVSLLQQDSTTNAVAIAALDRLAKGHANLTTPVVLTKALNVSPSDTAALQTSISLFDLIAGTILVADGVNGFKLGNGNLGTKIAGVASLTSASLNVIENPRTSCGSVGSPKAHTSQVSGSAVAKLELPTINLGGGDIVQTTPASVALTVNLGNAEGWLSSDPVCATAPSADQLKVAVQSGVATFSLTTTLGFRTTVNIAGVGQVEITWEQTASTTRALPDQSTEATLNVPPNDVTPVSTGQGDATLGGVTVASLATNVVATTKVAGVSIPVALDVVTPVLQPLVSALAVHTTVDGRLDTLASSIDGYLTPLLTLLGINVSGADVFAVGRPTCSSPVLRG